MDTIQLPLTPLICFLVILIVTIYVIINKLRNENKTLLQKDKASKNKSLVETAFAQDPKEFENRMIMDYIIRIMNMDNDSKFVLRYKDKNKTWNYSSLNKQQTISILRMKKDLPDVYVVFASFLSVDSEIHIEPVDWNMFNKPQFQSFSSNFISEKEARSIL